MRFFVSGQANHIRLRRSILSQRTDTSKLEAQARGEGKSDRIECGTPLRKQVHDGGIHTTGQSEDSYSRILGK